MINRLELKLVKISQSVFYFCVWMIKFIIFSLFCNIKLEGQRYIPKKGRFILAANHQNFCDGFFLAYALGPFKKVSFVIAKRALKSKSMRLLARLIGSGLLGNSLEDYQRVLKNLNKVLSHGGRVGIFPEGDISPRAIPKKFKGGVAKLSIDSRTKVIPVFLGGTYNLRYLKYLLTRPTITIKIGKPVELYNYASENGNNLDQIASILREKIIELGTVGKAEDLDVSTNFNPVPFSYSSPVKEPIVEA
ncbi:MAG: hypothetical protein A3I68_08500 [Candidatus Melainabacteria bacterium RIFCSPLOWO2_02_FULL_35_15]|nr:MAG: hypothetical protein A3F80_08725 [Candidatus Melainabacteria bacterium RIFCSPLOWO2_12_FULL_35_11]OGI14010.1 MAG: hypothetical protein A3I68_08500 [Candidatus Melainabacteria bacterium RIFCSPLOWO2_02_FULL_35_15]